MDSFESDKPGADQDLNDQHNVISYPGHTEDMADKPRDEMAQ